MKNAGLVLPVRCIIAERNVFEQAMKMYFPTYEGLDFDYETGYEVYLDGNITATDREIIEALSAFFAIQVTEFHTDNNTCPNDPPRVWIAYKA